MAELRVMGPYEGPGERMTAEYLASVLPSDWHVIAGRKLPNESRDDVDIFILATNSVILVEEKHWGPVVAIGDHRWSVVKTNGRIDERENPLNSATAKARKAASWLRTAIVAGSNLKYKFVNAAVIMSYPDVQLREKPNFNLPDNVFGLNDSLAFLMSLDALAIDPFFQAKKAKILESLLDLLPGEAELTYVGDYKLESLSQSEPGLSVYVGEHKETGEQVLLKCFDETYWGHNFEDAEANIRREAQALTKLVELNRCWRYHAPFYFEPKNWTVIPLVKPNGITSLSALMMDETRNFFRNYARQISQDAFACLAEIHAERVVHRAISPQRIWIGKSFKIILSDFYLSHIDGKQSIIDVGDDLLSMPYRDSNALRSIHLADSKSDVYAMAYSLAVWLTDGDIEDKKQIIQRLQSSSGDIVSSTLLLALDDDPELRPEASKLAHLLEAQPPVQRQIQESASVFEVGALISGRYRLLSKLGSGGVATTWKASDQESDGALRVLKRIHNAQLLPHVLAEVKNSFSLAQNSSYARVIAVNDKPEPGYLVSDFVDGVTLEERAEDVNFGVQQAREVCAKTLRALSELHSQDYVHGDISPRNIIVDDNLNVTLIDLGLVAKIGAKNVLGTPLTMPPEVIAGESVGPWSDIYSTAVSFVSVLLKRPPYAGDPYKTQSRDYKIVALDEAEKDQWGDEGSALLEALFQACSPSAFERPQNCEEMLAALQNTIPQPVHKLPEKGSEPRKNVYVDELRSLYVRSSSGAYNSLGLATDFAQETYVPTLLDTELLPAILSNKLSAVFLTGNPGDGKTSFLQRIFLDLKAKGAVGVEDEEGWRLNLFDHEYVAVYDASESTRDKSSDRLISDSLQGLGSSNRTALLAINDGRLKQFFEDFDSDFPELASEVEKFFRGEALTNEAFAIVDLKERALVGLDGGGLTGQMLDIFTASKNWEECGKCAASTICPILSNRDALAGVPRKKVENLLAISHLRRKRRSTLRQVRSTLGWLITGDLSCEDVTNSLVDKNNVDLSHYYLPELVFGGQSTDPLIQEWRELDPGKTLSFAVEEILREPDWQERALYEKDLYNQVARKLYFSLLSGVVSPSLDELNELNLYHYVDEYKNMLSGSSQLALGRVLLGISRIVGAPGYSGEGLAISSSRGKEGWAALKPISASEFTFQSSPYVSPYIEAITDRLVLRHRSGASLAFSLDTAEVVFRAADGEIFNDSASLGIRYEIESFARQLLRQPGSRVTVISPSGKVHEIVSDSGEIELQVGFSIGTAKEPKIDV